MSDLRKELDDLAVRIRDLKKEHGPDHPEVKAAVAKMMEMRKGLPAKKEKKEEPTYFESRVATVEERGSMTGAYPHKFETNTTIPEFVAAYTQDGQVIFEKGQQKRDVVVRLAGRVQIKRSSGSKLQFIDIMGDSTRLQVISSEADFALGADLYKTVHSQVKRGDIVGIEGYPGASNAGELSIFATNLVPLSYCLHMLPLERSGLKNVEERLRCRFLDLIVNPSSILIFEARAKVIRYLRRFLDDLNFVEVETPILNRVAGGAAARPFVTYHNELRQRMFLRIAPELPLKELIVGGMDRVYEIGRQFRNEGIDPTHNPEFTSAEFYWAYKDYEDLMTITEQMLSRLATHLHGTTDVVFQPVDNTTGKPGDKQVFNFKPPFQRLHILPELEARLGVKFPDDFETPEMSTWLMNLCRQHKVEMHPPFTTARLFDALIAHVLEPLCTQPTFLCDHPRIMSPLAKWHRKDPRLSERFELFLNQKELCNAYTELNNPLVQRKEFEKQLQNRTQGDDEAMEQDETFLLAIEHGLPPTAGWGLGIDRLVMFLTSCNSIKEVILFPALKPEGSEHAATFERGTKMNGQGVPLWRPKP